MRLYMKKNILLVCTISILSLLLSGCVVKPLADSLPNVVLIFTDDLGYADLSSYGATEYQTPFLDQMASEGVRFTDFYVSQAICSASRAALLTGSYPNRIGIHGALGPASQHGIHDQEITLAELFKGHNYSTALFGKWHLGSQAQFHPTRHGFDYFYGIPHSNDMWPYHPENPEYWPDLPTYDGEEIVGINTDQSRFTTDFTQRSIGFMEQAVAAGKPFFLYLAHPMPHVPLSVSAEREGVSGAGLYADVIREIDWSVGQVLATLESLGVDDNTLVMFISDNGPWLSYGNHAGSAGPLREGKGTAWEGGVRVPFIARWPDRIPSSSVVTTPAMTIDIFPTLAHLLDANLPEHPIDGKSIWSLMSGESNESVQEAYYFYYNQNELHALRSGNWKLHFPHGYRTMEGQLPGGDGKPGRYNYDVSTELELYDLSTDISEQFNVVNLHADIVADLMLEADSIREKLGDSLNDVEAADSREPGRIAEE